MSKFFSNDVSLNTLFNNKNPVNNPAPSSAVNYLVNGVDISNNFNPYKQTTWFQCNPTGYKYKGTDLNAVFDSIIIDTSGTTAGYSIIPDPDISANFTRIIINVSGDIYFKYPITDLSFCAIGGGGAGGTTLNDNAGGGGGSGGLACGTISSGIKIKRVKVNIGIGGFTFGESYGMSGLDTSANFYTNDGFIGSVIAYGGGGGGNGKNNGLNGGCGGGSGSYSNAGTIAGTGVASSYTPTVVFTNTYNTSGNSGGRGSDKDDNTGAGGGGGGWSTAGTNGIGNNIGGSGGNGGTVGTINGVPLGGGGGGGAGGGSSGRTAGPRGLPSGGIGGVGSDNVGNGIEWGGGGGGGPNIPRASPAINFGTGYQGVVILFIKNSNIIKPT
jgi:hypothetical protein